MRNPITFLLLWLTLSLSAQEITLAGSVHAAADNSPLVGAYVYPKTRPGLVETTDAEGNFRLTLPAPDTLIVSYLGYQELRQAVTEGGELILFLKATESASIDALTVRARRIPNGELASERISQMDIYLNPAAKADPLLAVNSLPSATNPDETANVSFRGSPSAATGVYLNDVPIRSAVRLDQSNGVGQFSIFGRIPLRDVLVYPGHPPVNFSQTSAGAVGLYTSAELPTTKEHGLSVSMAGLGLAHSRPVGEKSGVRAFVNYGNLTAFRFANQRGLPELKRSRSLDAAVQFVHQFTPKSNFQLFYLGFQESFRFETTSPYYTGDLQQEKPRHLAVLNWRFEREKWTWALNQSADWEHAEFRLGNIYTSPRRFTGHVAAHGRYQGAGFSLLTGTALNAYADRTTGSFPLVNYAIRPEDPSQAYAAEAASQLLEAYAYGQVRLGDKWLLGAGLKPVVRLDANEVFYTAQASLRFRPGGNHRFNLGGGHFSQYLAPGPEFREWQWLELDQLALEYAFETDDWTVEAAVYTKRENYAQTPDLRVKGAELLLGFEGDGWLARVSGAVARSRSVESNVPTERDLPFLARTQVQRQFDGQWTVGLAATWRRGRYFQPVIGREPIVGREDWFAPVFSQPDAGLRYPNFQRVDISASKALPVGNTQLILFVNVNNALNAENVSSYTYDAAYRERSAALYSRRLVFLGGVLRW
jgi:hypothetical protein